MTLSLEFNCLFRKLHITDVPDGLSLLAGKP